MVVHGVAVGNRADHGVVHEFRVGVQVLGRGQFLLFGQLLTLLGIPGELDGERDDLEIEVVGLVYGGHQVFFRGDHVVGAGLEVCEKRLHDLDSE